MHKDNLGFMVPDATDDLIATLERQLAEARKLLQRVSVATTASDVKTWRDTMDALTAYLYPPPQEPKP
jgi:hypothetical protein